MSTEPPSPIKSPQPDLIHKLLGHWGPYQRRGIFLIYLCKIPAAWFMACVIFTAPIAEPGEYYCSPPDTVNVTNTSQWITYLHPTMSPHLFTDTKMSVDFCHVYKSAADHAEKYFNYTLQNEWKSTRTMPNSMIVPCDDFSHDSPFNSLTTQFDLVCSRNILIAVTQFFHLFGVLLGGMVATKTMEFVSPKITMVIGMVAQIVCGVATGIVNWFALHCLFRMLSAMCCAMMFTPGQAIFADITGGKYRTATFCMFENFWSIGLILLPGIARIAISWIYIYWMISLPAVGYIILWYYIPDSPTWLIQHGFVKEVHELLLEAVTANGNKSDAPADLKDQLIAKAEYHAKVKEIPPRWIEIFEGPDAIRHMLAAHIAWACYVINFNGMTLNIRAFGRDYLTANTIVVGFSEIIGVMLAFGFIMLTQNKWVYSGVFSIVSCLIAWAGFLFPDCLVGTHRVIALMVIAMIAKMGTSIGQAMLFTCTAEMVKPNLGKPTMYSCIVFARVFLLIAPFICVLNIFHQVLPLAVFGALNLVGGVCTCFLVSPRTWPKKTKKNVVTPPETPMVDTVLPSTSYGLTKSVPPSNAYFNNGFSFSSEEEFNTRM